MAGANQRARWFGNAAIMWLASNEGGQFAGNFARNVALFREKEG